VGSMGPAPARGTLCILVLVLELAGCGERRLMAPGTAAPGRLTAFARMVALLGAVVLAGCSLLVAPDWVRERPPLPSCGEMTMYGDAAPIDGNRCLRAALDGGTGAELIVRYRDPAEGLPTDTYTRILPDGRAELIIHVDPERSGQEGWELHRCASVELTDPATQALQLTNCEKVTDP